MKGEKVVWVEDSACSELPSERQAFTFSMELKGT